MSLSHLLLLAQVEASCTLNGRTVPCEQLEEKFGGLFAGFGIFFVIIIVLGLLATVFTIWMIVDAATRDFENKALWIVVMFFTGIFGAIVYYFAVKRTNKITPQSVPSPSSHASQEPAPQQPSQDEQSNVVQPGQQAHPQTDQDNNKVNSQN